MFVSSSDMFYPHHFNDTRLLSMTVSVCLQNIQGTYSNQPKTQEVGQNSGRGYSMVPHDTVSHGQPI